MNRIVGIAFNITLMGWLVYLITAGDYGVVITAAAAALGFVWLYSRGKSA